MRLFELFREKELMSRPSLVSLKNKMRRSRKDCNEIFEDQTNDRVNEQRGRFRENESDEEDIRGMVLNYNFITRL